MAGSFLALLAGRETDALLEVRCRRPSDGRITAREWFPVIDLDACRSFIYRHAPELDVYVGVAPRVRREGGKDAIRRGWVLWVDCDSAESVARLSTFRPFPTLVVHSGTGENRHAYWALSNPVPPAWLERANRRLAFALGADMKATDAARILRPPGTLNHKHDPAALTSAFLPVGQPSAISVLRAVGNLADPPDARPVAQARADTQADDALLGVSADRYYSTLTGRPVTRGNVTCPFHNDGMERSPSMRLYDTTWYCFGCGDGGSVYEFGARLWGLCTRGADFLRLKERLTDALG